MMQVCLWLCLKCLVVFPAKATVWTCWRLRAQAMVEDLTVHCPALVKLHHREVTVSWWLLCAVTTEASAKGLLGWLCLTGDRLQPAALVHCYPGCSSCWGEWKPGALETVCPAVLLPAGSELGFSVHCNAVISHVLESIFQECGNFS